MIKKNADNLKSKWWPEWHAMKEERSALLNRQNALRINHSIENEDQPASHGHIRRSGLTWSGISSHDYSKYARKMDFFLGIFFAYAHSTGATFAAFCDESALGFNSTWGKYTIEHRMFLNVVFLWFVCFCSGSTWLSVHFNHFSSFNFFLLSSTVCFSIHSAYCKTNGLWH